MTALPIAPTLPLDGLVAEIEAKGITVTVEGGRVRLDGKVRAWREPEAVARAAWAAPGVTGVDDRVTVAP